MAEAALCAKGWGWLGVGICGCGAWGEWSCSSFGCVFGAG